MTFLITRRRRHRLSGGGNSPPNTPTISAGTPTSSGATLTGSAFSDSDVGDTHAASQWRVTRVSDSVVVYNPGDDTVNKTSLVWTGGAASTAYTAEVRYKDSAGNYSAWATPTAPFTTASASVIGTPNQLTAGTQGTSATTGATTFSTAVVTPNAGAATILSVTIRGQVGTATPIVSGGRATWTLVKKQSNSGSTWCYVFVGTGAATAQAITVTAGGTDTWGPVIWSVTDYPNADQVTPIRATSTTSAVLLSTDAVFTITALQAMAGGNALHAAFAFNGGGGTATPRAGWTELSDNSILSAAFMETQYRLSTDTAAQATADAGAGYTGGGVLCEINHA